MKKKNYIYIPWGYTLAEFMEEYLNKYGTLKHFCRYHKSKQCKCDKESRLVYVVHEYESSKIEKFFFDEFAEIPSEKGEVDIVRIWERKFSDYLVDLEWDY